MAEIKKTEAAAKPVATIKTPAAAEVKEAEVKAETAKKETVKKAAVKKAAAPKKAEVKKAEVKKEEVKKEEVKKEEVKAEKKVAAKKTATAKKEAVKKPAEKKATAKKATKETSEVKANIVLQYGDKDVPYDVIIENSKNNYQYEMGGNVDEITKLSVYVKPEENAAYYVVNDKVQGRVEL